MLDKREATQLDDKLERCMSYTEMVEIV